MSSNINIGKSLQQLRDEKKKDEKKKDEKKKDVKDKKINDSQTIIEMLRKNKRTQYLIDLEFEP